MRPLISFLAGVLGAAASLFVVVVSFVTNLLRKLTFEECSVIL